MKDKVTDELAKDLFDIDRNKGNRFVSLNKYANLDEAESYVNHQMDRLRTYAKAGEMEKFDSLAKKLLTKSDAYLLYAINHVYPDWHKARFTKIPKLLKKVIIYAINNRDELHYKRVWIDKTPGDYGRPLGVPEMADRIYGHMMTRIMESYLCGTNQYSPIQHGGVPNRGTNTYLTALVEQFAKSKHIFEFDIKGYFDNIKHSTILEMFTSRVILNYLSGVLNSRPRKYNLPPELFDRAQIEHEKTIKLTESLLDDLEELMNIPPEEGETDILDSLVQVTQRDGESYTDASINLIQAVADWAEEDVSGSTLYSRLMEDPDKVTDLDIEHFTQREREEGRDMWKSLHLPGQGVPQGSSFGPTLASVLLGKVMPTNSLLYMDDGIIFLGNQRTTKERMVRKVNKLLSPIGCELNINKSALLNTNILKRQGLKIIGLRIKRTYFNYPGMLISSETRNGIVRPFFNRKDIDLKLIIQELYLRGYLTISKFRILRWYAQTNALQSVSDLRLVNLANSIGILGAILNRAVSPTTSLEEMKEQIEYGIFKAELSLKSSVGSLGERIINHSKTILIEGTEQTVHVKPNIYITRSIANNTLLLYLKGVQPRRSLRVQGMRKPFKRPTQSKIVRYVNPYYRENMIIK